MPRPLLAIMLRANRFGALTAAGLAEVATRLAFGVSGFLPMALIVPVLANMVGDVAWSFFRRLPERTMSLMLPGGVLCGARVLLALVFWAFLKISFPTYPHLSSILIGIIAINIALGMIAGYLVAKTSGIRKRVVVDDKCK